VRIIINYRGDGKVKHNIMYRNGRVVKGGVGFVELNKASCTLTLKINRTCSRFKPVIVQLHKDILALLSEPYVLDDISYNVKKNNKTQKSRVDNANKRFRGGEIDGNRT